MRRLLVTPFMLALALRKRGFDVVERTDPVRDEMTRRLLSLLGKAN
jgi:hypothetical protein